MGWYISQSDSESHCLPSHKPHLTSLLPPHIWTHMTNKSRYKFWTYHALSHPCIFAIRILKVSIWRQLRFCLSVNKQIKIYRHLYMMQTNTKWYFSDMDPLLRKLKLCMQILRCYHFFNIFWVCWSMCFCCSGPQARRYLFSCTC